MDPNALLCVHNPGGCVSGVQEYNPGRWITKIPPQRGAFYRPGDRAWPTWRPDGCKYLAAEDTLLCFFRWAEYSKHDCTTGRIVLAGVLLT